MIHVAIDLADVVQAVANQEPAFVVEILRLLKIGKDIILFINEGVIDDPGPERNIDERMFSGAGIIVQVIDPGAIPGLHILNKPVDRGGIVPVFPEGIFQAGLACLKFINICNGVGDEG
jgi:hypothetical protein